MREYFPDWYRNKKDLLWIGITPKIMKRRALYTNPGRGATYVATPDNNKPEYMFLAPREMENNTIHNWEPMDNLITKLAGLEKGVRNMLSGMSTSVVNAYLMYIESPRREFSLSFNLATKSREDHRKIMNVTRELQKISSPLYKNAQGLSFKAEELGVDISLPDNRFLLSVDPPYVFGINCYTSVGDGNLIRTPHPIFRIEKAAITAIQPTFKGPYRDGIPTHIDLTIQFTDVDVLSETSFDQGRNIVTTGSYRDGGGSIAQQSVTQLGNMIDRGLSGGKQQIKQGQQVITDFFANNQGGGRNR